MSKKLENAKKFVDEKGTIYTKGPFEVDGQSYDYLIEDSNGIDYCTLDQLKLWEVTVAKVLENE